MDASAPTPMVRFAVEDPTTPDARWCIEQYFAELNARFEAGFDPTLSISADAHELTPPAGALLVARLRGDRSAAGRSSFTATGRPSSSGCGSRQTPVASGSDDVSSTSWSSTPARRRHHLRLETNRALTEAIALYRRSGYREVAAFNDEPYAHHWFEKRLT